MNVYLHICCLNRFRVKNVSESWMRQRKNIRRYLIESMKAEKQWRWELPFLVGEKICFLTSICLSWYNSFQASYAEFIAEAQATASRRKFVSYSCHIESSSSYLNTTRSLFPFSWCSVYLSLSQFLDVSCKKHNNLGSLFTRSSTYVLTYEELFLHYLCICERFSL